MYIKCNKCGKAIPEQRIKSHVKNVKRKNEN